MKRKGIILFLFLISSSAIGQNIFSLYTEQDSQWGKVKISSNATIQQFFSLPIDVDFSLLNDLDFAVMVSKNHNENVIETINNDNTITIIKLLEHPETCVPSMFDDITGVRLNIDSVSVYGADGGMVYSEANDLDEIPYYTIAEDDIYSYGIYNSWFGMQNHVKIDSIINHYSTAGFVTDYEDGILLAVNDTLEVEIDFEYLVYEERYFDNDTLVLISQKRFSDIDGKYIPLQDITIRYNYLPYSGIRYQISEIKTYNYYEIVNDNGSSVVCFGSPNGDYSIAPDNGTIYQYKEIEKHNQKMKVYPNPVTNELNVELPFNITGKVTVEIYSVVGQRISHSEIVTQNTLKVNTENLPKGSYIIKCSSNKNVASKNFIKQ